ncbi:unnamed protein product [Gulo gulo]|uniref:Uncharacterized protein n=1 Tax=Gulo gulo TaxID=48420 RepID=A0A9X9LQY1_GULGU|nr:unnamed protein product [Gulo gulo]
MLLGCPLLERRRTVPLATLDFITMDHHLAIPALLERFRMEQRNVDRVQQEWSLRLGLNINGGMFFLAT